MQHNNNLNNDIPDIRNSCLNVSPIERVIADNINDLRKLAQGTMASSSGYNIYPNYPIYEPKPRCLPRTTDEINGSQTLGFPPEDMSNNSVFHHRTDLGSHKSHSEATPDNLTSKADEFHKISNYNPPNLGQIQVKKFGIMRPEFETVTFQDYKPHFIDEEADNLAINYSRNEEPIQETHEEESQRNDLILNYSKRKRLEKTVKLIDDILSNHAPSDNHVNEGNTNSNSSSPGESSSEGQICDSFDSTGNSKDNNVTTQENVEIKTEDTKDSDPDNQPVIQFRETFITVKLETSFENEDNTPFVNDMNGQNRELIDHCHIIDGDNSEAEAREAINMGGTSYSYYECPHCSLCFEHPKRFLIHTKWHTISISNEPPAEKAKRVKKEAEDTTEKPVKIYKCSDCEKVFKSKNGLRNHRSSFHHLVTHTCKVCNEQIVGYKAYQSHMYSHNSTGYQCPDCPKKYKFPQSLVKHRDKHMEKTLQCPNCPKLYGSPAALKIHSRTHTKVPREPTHTCSHCGRAFHDAFTRQVHERSHTKEKPFSCSICNATYSTNSSLTRHLKVSHNGSKPYECSVCHRAFATTVIRDRHELKTHGDQSTFKYRCGDCDGRFLTARDLRKHRNKEHPITDSKTCDSDD